MDLPHTGSGERTVYARLVYKIGLAKTVEEFE